VNGSYINIPFMYLICVFFFFTCYFARLTQVLTEHRFRHYVCIHTHTPTYTGLLSLVIATTTTTTTLTTTLGVSNPRPHLSAIYIYI
jgi:hypothetical protein